MHGIRHHYEELKSNEEYFKKQIEDLKDQLDHQKSISAELRDNNKRLLRENKDVKLEVMILKKSMVVNEADEDEQDRQDEVKRGKKRTKKLPNLIGNAEE